MSQSTEHEYDVPLYIDPVSEERQLTWRSRNSNDQWFLLSPGEWSSFTIVDDTFSTYYNCIYYVKCYRDDDDDDDDHHQHHHDAYDDDGDDDERYADLEG